MYDVHWNNLPREIRLKIFEYLYKRDLLALLQVNKETQEILESCSGGYFWREKCMKLLWKACRGHYKQNLRALNSSRAMATDFKRLYLGLLGRFGSLLGYWIQCVPEEIQISTLLCFQLSSEENCLIQSRLHLSKQGAPIWEQMQHIHENGELIPVRNLGGEEQSGSVKLQSVIHHGQDNQFHEQYGCIAERFQLYTQEAILGEKCQGILQIHDPDPRKNDFLSIWDGYLYRLRQHPSQDSALIRSGCFTAVYGAHGYELLHAVHLQEKNEIIVTKILGDPNVPALRQSIVVDLTKPLMFTVDDQDTMHNLSELSMNNEYAETGPQPFVLPGDNGMYLEGLQGSGHPSHCLVRYNGEGTLAYTQFQNPQKSKLHWMKFDEDTFGIMWMSLKTFTMFKRVDWLEGI